VRDVNASANVVCTLTGVFQSGDESISSTLMRQTSGFSSSWQVLSYGPLSAFNPGSDGYYFFSCTIPPASANGTSAISVTSATES
jgi:hypothetical protein